MNKGKLVRRSDEMKTVKGAYEFGEEAKPFYDKNLY
jgi:hypothetical protein